MSHLCVVSLKGRLLTVERKYPVFWDLLRPEDDDRFSCTTLYQGADPLAGFVL